MLPTTHSFTVFANSNFPRLPKGREREALDEELFDRNKDLFVDLDFRPFAEDEEAIIPPEICKIIMDYRSSASFWDMFCKLAELRKEPLDKRNLCCAHCRLGSGDGPRGVLLPGDVILTGITPKDERMRRAQRASTAHWATKASRWNSSFCSFCACDILFNDFGADLLSFRKLLEEVRESGYYHYRCQHGDKLFQLHVPAHPGHCAPLICGASTDQDIYTEHYEKLPSPFSEMDYPERIRFMQGEYETIRDVLDRLATCAKLLHQFCGHLETVAANPFAKELLSLGKCDCSDCTFREIGCGIPIFCSSHAAHVFGMPRTFLHVKMHNLLVCRKQLNFQLDAYVKSLTESGRNRELFLIPTDNLNALFREYQLNMEHLRRLCPWAIPNRLSVDRGTELLARNIYAHPLR